MGPAFALFRRMRTMTMYGLVMSPLIAATIGSITLLTLAVRTSGSDWSTIFSTLPSVATLTFVGAVVFSVGLYFYAALTILARFYFEAFERGLTRFGSGDLSLQFLPGWGNASEGQAMWTALNQMNKDFPNIVRQVRASAQNIANGSREIAQGYTDLSQRTEEQASTLEETAASLEELTATVKQNADNCREANVKVEQVGQQAENAAQSMQQVSSNMSGIEQSAKRMTEFVSIIEGIAFQTNILALNAAVEAARAGEQGRGFAVVAAEVRALAQRSAQATEEIKDLIAASSGHVSEGAALVAQAEQAVERAVAGIHHAVELIGSIASASEEQNAGMQLISKALTQLEVVTQQNAAQVEEGTATTASFEQESHQLVDVVSVFRLQDEVTPEHALTTGNRRTAAHNAKLGAWRPFIMPALSLFVRNSYATMYAWVAAPLVVGPVCLFVAALLVGGHYTAVTSAYEHSLVALLLTAGVLSAFALGVYFYTGLTLWATTGSNFLAHMARKLAAGDLAWTLKIDTSPGAERLEAYRINRALGRIQKQFSDIVRQVRASAHSVVNGAREIALGYTELSHRTEEQASTLEETAASMEELSATVKQNADSCAQANIAVQDVGGRAEEAAAAMQQVTSTMARIEASTKKMTEFVGIIEGIAFQTNILALNAAVEAARAGEQGRGFAVVAAEVRALAQRSAQATDEIKALIGSSSGKVAEGSKLVAKAEQAVNRAVAGIQEVVGLISAVASASAEQNSGVQMVSKALTQLEGVTQQNAALVEEGAAAAASFERESGRLIESVSVFRLDRAEKEGKKAATSPEDGASTRSNAPRAAA